MDMMSDTTLSSPELPAEPPDRRRLARAAIGLLDATWLWAWLTWIGGIAVGPVPPLAALAGAVWFGAWTARRLGRLSGRDSLGRIGLAAAFGWCVLVVAWLTRGTAHLPWEQEWIVMFGRDLTGIGATSPGAIPLLLGVGVAVILGARLSPVPMLPPVARRAVLRAIVALVILALLSRVVGGSARFNVMLPLTALFALGALSGSRRAAMASASVVWRPQRVGTLAGALGIGTALVFGGLAAAVASLDRADAVFRALAPVEFLLLAARTIVLAFAWLTYGVLYLLISAISALFRPGDGETPSEPSGLSQLRDLIAESGPTPDMPVWVIPAL